VVRPALGCDHAVLSDTQPDCENDGLWLVECSRCGYEVERVVRPALGCDHVVLSDTQPDCENDGLWLVECSRCGYEVERVVRPALGCDHVVLSDTQPDCENDGLWLVECSRCSYEVERVVRPALGCDLEDWTETLASTCVVYGEETRLCQRLGCTVAPETRPIPTLGHSMPDFENDAWELVTAPTCVATGLERQVCERIGCNHEVTRPITALGHDWGAWVVTRAPTVTIDGEERRDCTRIGCMHFETRPIVATGETDVTVTFIWNYDRDGDSVFYQKTIDHGTQASTPAVSPAREGYNFMGWYLQPGTTDSKNFANPVVGNLRLYARWVREWTVTFDLNGGAYGGNQALLSQTVLNGENATALTAYPTREGYVFDGWSPELNLTNVTDNLTFTAQWAEDYVISPPPGMHTWFMMGRSCGNFVPSGNITRAEVATMLVRTMIPGYSPTLPLPTRMPFPDVSANDWFYGYVAWAYDAGFIEGRPDGTFDPRAQISRQEVAAMVVRATNTTIQSAGDFSIADADQISNWARDYVYTVYRQGWMTGNSQNQLQPRRSITRAETAAVFSRVLERGVTNADSLVDVVDDLRIFPDVAHGRWYYYYVIEATHTHEFIMEDGVEIWSSVTLP